MNTTGGYFSDIINLQHLELTLSALKTLRQQYTEIKQKKDIMK